MTELPRVEIRFWGEKLATHTNGSARLRGSTARLRVSPPSTPTRERAERLPSMPGAIPATALTTGSSGGGCQICTRPPRSRGGSRVWGSGA